MKISILPLLLLLTLPTARAQEAFNPSPPRSHVSAVRAEDESWKQAALKHLGTTLFAPRSAMGSAKPFPQLNDVSALPEWTADTNALLAQFENARDVRPYGSRTFPRRSTWLYPNDGCYARASHVSRTIGAAGVPRPGKVFAFGNLTLRTPYSRTGRVSWWFHVAAAYRQGTSVVVLDPAVEARHPLALAEWIARISRSPQAVRVSLCDPSSYFPRDICIGGSSRQERSAIAHQMGFLNPEWNRVVSLRLDPRKVLGEEPPWAQTPRGSFALLGGTRSHAADGDFMLPLN